VRRSSPDDPEDAEAVRARAVKLLARREHAPAELERKLTERGFEPATVRTVLDELIEDGLLSESRYAASFARSRAERGHGPVRIRAELSAKGVSESEVDAALAQLDVDWQERAMEVRRHRFGADAPQALEERARQSRFLQRRGFSGDHIRAAFPRRD